MGTSQTVMAIRATALACAGIAAGCSSSAEVAGIDGASCPAIGSPVISAHRGGAAYAPENTLMAFRNAVRLGVDELEMDTQLTADGELVVIHDDSVDRTTNCSGTVGSMTLADIQACDAAYWFVPGQGVTTPSETSPHPLRGQGVVVPTLRVVLDWHARLPCPPRLSIEIKNIPGEANFDLTGTKVAHALVPLLQSYGLADRAIVQSFWPLSLTVVRQMEPRLKTQFLSSSANLEPALANLAVVIASGFDISAPNYDAPLFRQAYVNSAHAANKAVIPFTVDAATDQQSVAALGVDGLITNFPACALQRLRDADIAHAAPDNVPDTPACPPDVQAAAPAAAINRPDAQTCAALRPARWAPETGQADARGALRVVALQYKQEIRHVVSYAAFRTKMRCLVEDHVVPVMKPGRPTLAVFNEDAGLMTIATGSRGALVRAQAQTPLGAPLGDAVPLGIVAALGLLNTAYLPQVLAYQARFPLVDPRKAVFLAATDTFARAFSQTFSDIARDYGIYVVASNNQARYHASRKPLDIATFHDPDLAAVDEVYVADDARVANTTFLWGPHDVDAGAPRGETNLLFRNEKVPLTAIEQTVLGLDEGPATGDAARANAAGTTIEGFHLGFATSLPAFRFGYDFAARPEALAPCADLRVSYMSCMDALGVDVVVQAEANPGRWAGYVDGGWQPLEWMGSTWRTVAEPGVRFRYNITAHLVGNLLDLPFDGQSAITRRGADAMPRHYVGNLEFSDARDTPGYRAYVGEHPEFLALAPWVTADADRDALSATGTALAPGSRDPLENDYLETAVWADLVH